MVSDSFISTFWVFIFTLPIIIENFSEFTILSFIANLLILPVVNIATILGIINISLLFVSFPISQIFAFITYIPFFYIQKVIKLISQIPVDMIRIPFSFNTNHVFLYFFFLFIILMYISFNKFRKDIIEEG
jgi:competence protein ComEC